MSDEKDTSINEWLSDDYDPIFSTKIENDESVTVKVRNTDPIRITSWMQEQLDTIKEAKRTKSYIPIAIHIDGKRRAMGEAHILDGKIDIIIRADITDEIAELAAQNFGGTIMCLKFRSGKEQNVRDDAW